MKLNPPKTITWIIANIAGILSILLFMNYVTIPGVHIGITGEFWLAAGAFILLSISSLLRGL